MRRGVGVVALHQASTVPVRDTTIDLPRWLGGARYGMFDRTFELVSFQAAAHPIGNGVGEFLLNDEFYPTIRFPAEGGNVTPILTGNLHPQFRDGKLLVIDKAESRPVAWAFERGDGGRAFTFTGLHYLVNLDNPAVRKLLLNAIFWTAKMDVPKEGVRTTAPADAAQRIVTQEEEAAVASSPQKTITEAVVSRAADNQVVEYPWGRLTWYVSRALKNSDTMTVGEAVIRPGQENPRHYHPNCDEVLHVIRGQILQRMGDRTVKMSAGDTISIPAGVRHNAKNIGTEDAVLAISYSSADRQVIGE
jgi:quercetin dioxygenase-like cupin family protein/type 1 glutamine amidotransferase